MSFHERKQEAVRCYVSDQMTSAHGFSTRLGGVSEGTFASMNLGVRRGDDREKVLENYARLGRCLDFDPYKLVCAVQVHRDDIRVIGPEDWGKGLYAHTDYEADGLITNAPGTALMVYSADCGTLLFEDRATGAVGACHAGWRGTALGIAEKTARAMYETFGTRPQDLYVALGPCIGGCCFETDGDVPEAMRAALGQEAEAAITQKGEKYYVDLKTINTRFLERAGVPRDHIDVCPMCTACQPDLFWSHRRHGDQRGSLGAVIVAGGTP
jgi:hypothetical protein